jgi:hypothetical protein
MTFSAFLRRLTRISHKPRRSRRRPGPLSLESLEDRWLPSATIVVNTASDVLNINPKAMIAQVNAKPPQGGISLRDAIVAANNSAPGTTITFVANLDPIKPTSALPAITANGVTIIGVGDGSDDGSGTTLDGSLAGKSEGLVVAGNKDEIAHLIIQHFQKAGIRVAGNGDTIYNCGVFFNGSGVYLHHVAGLLVDFSFMEANSGDGIAVDNCSGITIHNTSLEANGGDGLYVIGGLPLHTRGGFITKITDSVVDANHGDGIHLLYSSHNIIGTGLAADANYIGSDPDNDPKEGNNHDGILIESSPQLLSSYNSITRNYISDNHGNGIALKGAGTSHNSVTRNVIGRTTDDKAPAFNNLDGVAIFAGAHNNQVGGTGLFSPDGKSGQGNLISSNFDAGVRLSDPGTTRNTVQGNLIGTDASGKVAASNLYGVIISAGASGNLIGGKGGTQVSTGQGNVISGNVLIGVSIFGALTNKNQVEGNTIGTDVTGLKAIGNGTGVLIQVGASDNVIGGSGLGNLISGNTGPGVDVRGAGTKGNHIQDNWIGTDSTGAKALGNQVGVIVEQGASNTSVGGVATLLSGASLGNVISGNQKSGVVLAGSGTTGNLVQANEIGTTSTGKSALGNGSDGVIITGGASGNIVGGINGSLLFFSPGNLISGNHNDGVELDTADTTNNKVQGNTIGSDWAGVKALANLGNGVVLTRGANGNFIGGDSAGAGNLISGNQKSGVVLDLGATANMVQHDTIGTIRTGFGTLGNLKDGVDLFSSGNTVADDLISANGANGLVLEGSQNTIQDDKIGTNVSGAGPLGNLQDGIFIDIKTGPGGNTIGGTAAGTGNLISANGFNGIEITGPASANNQIEGNRIGTDATGQTAWPNQHNGILVSNTSGWTIGAHVPAAGNLISGNKHDGVEIIGLGSSGIVVLGNRIGTNAAGTAAVPNQGNGVHLDKGANNNVIGGTGTTDGNLISSNVLDGVLIGINHDQGNQVLGNRIGTDVSGLQALGNGQNGVELFQSGHNAIGGNAAGAGNLISGNKQDGVRIAAGSGNQVEGNLIGTDATGQAALGNTGHGVWISQGALNNTIGGTDAGAPNTIAFNGKAGVAVGDAATTGNAILSDSIFSNGGLGIDLGDDGVTANTPGGPHQGPNDLQNTPVIQDVRAGSVATFIDLTLNSTPNSTFTIQLFASTTPDASGFGQGKTLLTTITVNTDGSGNIKGPSGSFIGVQIPQNLAGLYLSATATDSANNTSEFSQAMQVT